MHYIYVTYLICLFAQPDTGDYCEDEEYDEDGGEDDGEGDVRRGVTCHQTLHTTNQIILRPPSLSVVQLYHLQLILAKFILKR